MNSLLIVDLLYNKSTVIRNNPQQMEQVEFGLKDNAGGDAMLCDSMWRGVP